MGLPKISTSVSTCATLTSTFGSRRTRSKAARFSRSVTSSSAPPSKKSKIARGSRRFASTAQVLDVDRLPQGHNCGSLYLRKPNPCHACSLLSLPCYSRCLRQRRTSRPSRCASSARSRPRARSTSPRAPPPTRCSKILGQPVAVENKPGAGGNLGGADVARSAPDGYSMVMSTSGIQAINPALYAKMPLDPNKELISVAPLVVALQRAGGASVGAGAQREGSDRAREEGAGQVDLRLERQRHQHPHVGRDVHADHRHRHPAHPVQGQRARR